ncbi:FAD-binding protein [Hansschlegelia plantiphila]|uniref:2-hydroxy-acid oxidase n=1 Tax=Hansschlegelia plantiphila TaxID=374655 RepID=A0A9W6MUT4_9HYPH|nr:FAD-binding protein [Hansschlegelia plantiphila]GLK67228.1 2-hydroxy-acid oxidase [Hansschlegelia plantiphila]
MTDIVAPLDEAGVEATIRAAIADQAPLAIRGSGTRSGLGRPAQAARTLTTERLSGITLLEPSELVVSAKAGTPVAEVEAALAEKGQRLAFEPFDHRALYGTEGEPTIGGLVAANASGPRRVIAGAARDALIGVRLTTGRGETIRSGGRVMKNVTGYDIVKLAAGSHGTIGVITEATFKTLPLTESETTLVLEGLDDDAGVAALCAAMGSPFEVTGAAHLPARDGAAARTCLRLENFESQLRYRSAALVKLLRHSGEVTTLDVEPSRALWRQVGEAATLLGDRSRAVWRVSVAPTRAPGIVTALGPLVAAHFYDWSGGLIWIAVEPSDDAGAGAIRPVVAEARGHATLIRASAAIRAAVDVFEPQAQTLARLTQAVTASFDPAGVLNPGRMHAPRS